MRFTLEPEEFGPVGVVVESVIWLLLVLMKAWASSVPVPQRQNAFMRMSRSATVMVMRINP